MRKISSVLIIVVVAFLFINCKKDKTSGCFKLKVVYVYKGSNTECSSNILQVEESPDPEVAVGTYVTMTQDEPYIEHPSLGEIAYLKVKLKFQKAPGMDPLCPFDYAYLLHGNLCQ